MGTLLQLAAEAQDSEDDHTIQLTRETGSPTLSLEDGGGGGGEAGRDVMDTHLQPPHLSCCFNQGIEDTGFA